MSDPNDKFLSRNERGVKKMIAIGALLSSYSLSVVASVVEGETTVPFSLLLESEEFREIAQKANTLSEVVDWVNENY